MSDLPLEDICQWRAASWSVAIRYWDRVIGSALEDASILEVGARDGGLSLYFALRGAHVLCSDLTGPSEAASTLHERWRVASRIRYAKIDILDSGLPDASFDFVAFKSVLGALPDQPRAIQEMHRLLRPSGSLLFCENLPGSRLHEYLKQRFVAHASTWKYVELNTMDAWLRPFAHRDLRTFGFLAPLSRCRFMERPLVLADVLLCRLVPGRWQYIMYGRAVK